MPTAGKAAAAVLYAALIWYASQLIKPLFPEGADTGLFAEVNAAIALVLGWRIAGSRAGTGWNASISYGLTTVVAITFSALFLQCFAEMVRDSLKRRYDGPMEAIADVFEKMFGYFMMMATPEVLGTLLVGGIVAGLVTELVGRNYR